MQKRKEFYTALFTIIIFASMIFYGCNDNTTPPAGTLKKPAVTNTVIVPQAQKPEAVLEAEDAPEQEGYIYEQRGRRDPFSSLIIPTEEIKKDDSKIGTLEGYDLSEFVLLAIAQKGPLYYALLATPDKRSFTVNKGNTIGLRKGKVTEIKSDMIALVEYTKDYKGEKIPRQIILEFHKGE
jgi:Tfp pilus assembly protein PilP